MPSHGSWVFSLLEVPLSSFLIGIGEVFWCSDDWTSVVSPFKGYIWDWRCSRVGACLANLVSGKRKMQQTNVKPVRAALHHQKLSGPYFCAIGPAIIGPSWKCQSCTHRRLSKRTVSDAKYDAKYSAWYFPLS